MSTVDLSVVVWTRNNASLLPKCLAHLERQELPAARYEIIVVDDGSTDDTTQQVQRYAAGAPVPTRVLRQAQSGAARARNRAVQEARGRWVLFLDEELLASPLLLSQHLAAQEAAHGLLATIGTVEVHPEFPRESFTRWVLPEERAIPMADSRTLPFLDWRAYNLCLPREAVLEAGGFDEAFLFPFFDDAELAYRLAKRGMTGLVLPQARAYVWRASSFALERGRHYAKGYSLYTLRAKTGAPEIFARYSLKRNPLLNAFDTLAMPMYIRACIHLDTDPRRFGYLYRRILRYEVYRGYQDARRKRDPRRYVRPE